MWNVGMGEIAAILVLALIVFGPEKLPHAVKKVTTTVKALRVAAADATRNIQESAGWDDEDTRSTLNDLAELHPKRIVGSILDDAKPANGSAGEKRQVERSNPSTVGGSLTDFDPDTP